MIFKSYIVEENIKLIKQNLVLFYGENLGLKNDFKDKIRSLIGTEIIIFSQEEILKNKNNFFKEILNISLFENEKTYFINSPDDKFLEIIKEIETKITDQKIYLFSETLDKRSKLRSYFEKTNNCGIVACYSDSEMNIKKIINEKLKGFKGLSNENINLIMRSSNLNRSKLKNELEKIITFFDDKNIERKNLEAILDPKINDNFNFLKDSALNGDKIKTNELLNETLIEPEKNIYYLNLINQRLIKLSELNSLSRKTDITKAIDSLKPPIFWKDKPVFLNQVKKWNENKIKNILKKTYETEIEIKSNSMINKNILMKKLIVDICQLANA